MPLNIKITERDNSVYNCLSNWTNLVKEQQENNEPLTRQVLVEKYNLLSIQRKQREKIAKKWENSGFLDGLHGHVKENIAQLYEAQASSLLSEVNVGQTIGISSRGFGHFNIERRTFLSKIKSFFISIWRKIFKKKKEKLMGFDAITFPIIQRVFARTIALDLVSVQPLSLPTGLLYYLDKAEREDVYTRVVLVEKYKPYVPYFYSGLTTQDYFIPVRNFDEERHDGPAGR